MALDISIGQYFEGSSVIHKADPRVKLISVILYITVIFLAKNMFSFALLILSAIALIIISRIPIKIITKGMKPLILILVFTAILNIFWLQGDTLVFEFGIIHIYLEGIMTAIFMIIRITILLIGTSVILTYTTTPIALTDGLEQLLEPLKKTKLPVHEFSMMMTIALRFIPTLIEETDKIMNAQKARGADIGSGGIMQRAKALIPILIPLFISAFRRADELSTAMECRCYRGGEGRTRMSKLKLRAGDVVFAGTFIVLGALIIIINIYAPGFNLAY